MRLIVNNILKTVKQTLVVNSVVSSRLSSTYEGDGKTVASVMNKDLGTIMVSAVSAIGFRLNSGIRIVGPTIIFPRTILSWNIQGVEAVNEDSLAIFALMSPKVDIIVFGYGDAKNLPPDVKTNVMAFGRKHQIGLEILPTENAVATFNFLNHEKRFVVGAFIPPKKVKIYDDMDLVGLEDRQKVLLSD